MTTPAMQVVSVNVGTARRLQGRSFKGRTGIFKATVPDPVAVGETGLAGDAVLNTRYHGGPDQAIYLYRQEDYDWWARELGRELPPGTFGENLTLQGLPAANLPVGSQLDFADLCLQVTAPRIPCNTLAERMSDSGFAKQFIKAERPGLYCRVLKQGSIRAGEAFSLSAPTDGNGISTLDMFRAAYRKLTAEELQRLLAAPIDIRSRQKYEAQLGKITSIDR